MRVLSAAETRNAAAFWAKVQIGTPDECWPWLGYKRPSGHGLTSYQSMPIHAHRKAWILTYGPIRDGKCVNHKCDNPACCNPSPKHMYLGDRIDNMIDRWEKIHPGERMPRGRPHVITNGGLEKLWAMQRGGATRKECAAVFDVHVATIGRYLETCRKQTHDRLDAARAALARKNRV